MAATKSSQPANPFIKQLASSDRRVRDRALTSLRTFISRPQPIPSVELLKLWKGLFYCMWMSDKPRTQQQLARDLASLVDVLHRPNVVPFLEAFWKTMAREWVGIDGLRMDKFLYLVRVFVRKGFEVAEKGSWRDEGMVKGVLGVLEETPLSTRDVKVGNGLRYHVVDVFVDELDAVDAGRAAPLEVLLAPLRRLGKESPTKSVRKRVQEALEDERLADWKGEKEDEESGEEAEGKDDDEDDDGFAGFDD